MKKTILCLALLTALTLSACGSSGQGGSSSDVSQSTPEGSVEIPVTPQEDTMADMPAVYSELLDSYTTALNEKWDGNALTQNELNLIALDLYEGAPLEKIGYAVMDIDGNGTDELIIGTTAAVTDEFYNKMILDLYTIGEDGTRVQVFSSTDRNRYFYAGEQLFANEGSSSASDSSTATLHFEGTQLTASDKAMTKADYMQIDLTALNLWETTTETASENTTEGSSAELIAVLDEIVKDVQPGTAGSSLKAVPFTVKLLNWGISTQMTTDEIKAQVKNWNETKASNELVEFSEQIALIDGTYKELIGENAMDLLDSAGYEDAPYPWSDKPIETIEVVFETLGLR